jgi:hypothetical protein
VLQELQNSVVKITLKGLLMDMKEEFNKLIEKLKSERNEISLKIHLASMDAKQEYQEAEKKWVQVKAKAATITDDAEEASEEFVARPREWAKS